jgi:hypothetical protein
MNNNKVRIYLADAHYPWGTVLEDVKLFGTSKKDAIAHAKTNGVIYDSDTWFENVRLAGYFE